jgi:predicted HD superfamily hydrolase involved in NAD metabolism
MRYVIKGNFSPLNNIQLEYINEVMIKKGINEIYLLNKDEGNLFDISISEYDYLYKISQKDLEEEDFLVEISDNYDINYKNGDFREFSNKVVKYIFTDLELLLKIPEHLLSKNRYKHSISVAKTAVDICSYNNLNEHDAYVAGILHDISKEMNQELEKEWIKKYFPDCIKINQKIFHQYTAYIFIKEYMKYSNYDVLDAILHHVDGSSSKPLAMAIYIADKIEPLRGYDNNKEIALYKKSVKSCFDVVKSTQAKYLEQKLQNNNN